MSHVPPSPSPISDADLHAFVDHQLDGDRQAQVDAHLLAHPQDAERVAAYRAHKIALRSLFAPVLEEAVPQRLVAATVPRTPWYAQRWAAGLAVGVISAAAAWFARGSVDATAYAAMHAGHVLASGGTTATSPPLTGFALRAAVAHGVYSPEVRHPVEVGADQEQHLVAWLSKRLGGDVKAPSLQPLGYALVGGRLLPGDASPVAQFMYQDGANKRLTLYVTREAPKLAGQAETAFQFGQDGPVNVFYWVDRSFGYALSGAVDRQELARISKEVYRQIAPAS